MTGGVDSGYAAMLVSAASGLVGAVIGGATVLLSSHIDNRHVRRKEAEALRRLRGEETLADVGTLIALTNTTVLDALDGKPVREMPAQMFRVWTNVELYYSEHIPPMIEMQKKLSALFSTAAKGAQAISQNRALVQEQSKIMLEAEKEFMRASEVFRKNMVAELRY